MLPVGVQRRVCAEPIYPFVCMQLCASNKGMEDQLAIVDAELKSMVCKNYHILLSLVEVGVVFWQVEKFGVVSMWTRCRLLN